MQRSVESDVKISLFIVTALNLPVEVTTTSDTCWSYVFLTKLATELQVSENLIDAYVPSVVSSTYVLMNIADRIEQTQPFLSQLSRYMKLKLYVQLLIFVVVNGYFDARGRELMRNIRNSMMLTSLQFLFIEVQLSKSLLDSQIKISNKSCENKSKNSKYFRYAKIGVAAVGAGAVLAITGGLAAPAVAAAFVVMGGTTVAAAVSVTTMAAVFGSAGAGLTGYKMLRRTRGLQEFEFEQHDRKNNQLAVMVMVSGWIEDREDYKRAFGVVPNVLSLAERLTRYYQLYCPERLQAVEEEALMFADCSEQLFVELRLLYGKDPLSAEDLQPPYPEPPHDQLLQTLINQGIDPNNSAGDIEIDIITLNARRVHQVFNSSGIADGHHDNNSAVVSLAASDDVEYPSLTSMTADNTTASAVELDDIKSSDVLVTDNVLGEGVRGARPAHYWNWRELEICPLYELHLLRWELSLQQDLGHSIVDMLKSLSSAAVQNVLAYTVFAAMATAVMWPVALLKLTDMIDGLWTIAVERADLAGRELAKALLARPPGSRPVTLVGYSLGARVIFSCLKHLARSLRDEELSINPSHSESSAVEDVCDFDEDNQEEEDSSDDDGSLFEDPQITPPNSDSTVLEEKPKPPSRLYFFSKRSSATKVTESVREESKTSGVSPRGDVCSIVQDVVLLGAPVSLTSRFWKDARRVVAGRLVNGYSGNDKVLSIIYRYQRFKVGVSGIAPVTLTAGVENVDLSSLVDQHVDYCRKMKEILELLDLTNCCGAPTTVEEGFET